MQIEDYRDKSKKLADFIKDFNGDEDAFKEDTKLAAFIAELVTNQIKHINWKVDGLENLVDERTTPLLEEVEALQSQNKKRKKLHSQELYEM